MSAEAACLEPSPCQGSASCQRIWGTGSGPRGVCSGPHFNPWLSGSRLTTPLIHHHPLTRSWQGLEHSRCLKRPPAWEPSHTRGIGPHASAYLAHRGAAPGLWPLWKEGKVQLDHDIN